MSTVEVGKPVADFTVAANGVKSIRLSELKGKNVVLYFYPKADTPGCTREGEGFRDHHSEFAALDTVILGASRDSVRAQDNFRNKYEFPFDLIADQDETLCRHFDVIKLKKMYGRESMGVERSTFLIDKKGVLQREWRKVKVPGHVEDVLQAVKEI
jgi:peroxiredoxin Q/BCP